ncbi:unnamed protein product [Trifolium pratense]|uniref:Uncharacterized protein n=1 Tax=Trifolium pratense TaxID=57577 RepID=A0ACB0KVI0_TRIPR|nr:unnamed protein product [Trifolium pratense]
MHRAASGANERKEERKTCAALNSVDVSAACLNATDLFSSSYFEQKVVCVNIIAVCGEIAFQFQQALLV